MRTFLLKVSKYCFIADDFLFPLLKIFFESFKKEFQILSKLFKLSSLTKRLPSQQNETFVFALYNQCTHRVCRVCRVYSYVAPRPVLSSRLLPHSDLCGQSDSEELGVVTTADLRQ